VKIYINDLITTKTVLKKTCLLTMEVVTHESLRAQTVKQLRQLCKESQLTRYSKLNKHDLIEFIIQNKQHDILCGVCFENKRIQKRVCEHCLFDVCTDCYHIISTKCPQCRQIYANPHINKDPYLYVMNDPVIPSTKLIVLTKAMRTILYPRFINFFQILYEQFDSHKISNYERYVITHRNINAWGSIRVFAINENTTEN